MDEVLKASELVELGKFLHNQKYFNEEKEVLIGSIKIDFIKNKDILEIHEIKKSKAVEKAHIMQALYYVFYLETLGIKAKAILHYPKINETKEIYLTEEYKKELLKAIKEIEKIKILDIPPKSNLRSVCKNCAYYELCFVE